MESERIKLRPVQKDDLKKLAELMSDREIGVLSGEVYPITEVELDNFYDRCQKTDTRIWFVIIDKATNPIIGETGFLRIFMPWRTTDYPLMIWDRSYWNQQPRHRAYDAKRQGTMLNVSHCMFYKVVAVGFNTLCYDAEHSRETGRETAGIKPSARIKVMEKKPQN